jgi:macrolide-specific efflux system membrane fusion protein
VETSLKRGKLLLVVGALALAGGLAWWQPWRADEAPAYETARVERGTVQLTVNALGTLLPLQFVDVGTQVTGQLRRLGVEIGQTVKKGQLIAEIDPTLFESRVNQTSAAINNLRAQSSDRTAQLTLARQRVERNRSLMRSDAVSREDLEASEATLQQAEAGVASIEAQIRQQSSLLVADRANLRYTQIFAPMTGTVVSVTARQGQTLVAAQQAPVILRVADLSVMSVQAQVSEADISKIRVGTSAFFNTLGLPDRRWTGKVRQILPTPEVVNNVVLYNVLFDVENPDGVLLPQMSAQVTFKLKQVDDALTIPARAVIKPERSGKGKGNGKGKQGGGGDAKRADADGAPRPGKVKVVKDGVISEREVTLGLESRNQVQVIAGLAEGEEVVLPRPKSGDGADKGRGKGDKGGGSGGKPKLPMY